MPKPLLQIFEVAGEEKADHRFNGRKIWADGLGNPRKNAMNQCQFLRLDDLVRNLRSSTERDARPNYFWIDTLCCPLEKYTRIKAISQMAEVYRNARRVLVLDSAIYTVDSRRLDAAEICFRALVSSTWMRRLWPLQGEFCSGGQQTP